MLHSLFLHRAKEMPIRLNFRAAFFALSDLSFIAPPLVLSPARRFTAQTVPTITQSTTKPNATKYSTARSFAATPHFNIQAHRLRPYFLCQP
jgi:hypothetical protein